jgi:membrane protease YdiL (CAAX protease family)
MADARAAVLFVIMAFGFSWPIFFWTDVRLLPAFHAQGNEAAMWLAAWFGHALGMLGPAVSALLMGRLVHRKPLPPWKRSRPKYFILSAAAMLALWTLPGIAGLIFPGKAIHLRAPLPPFVWTITGASLTLGWLAGLGEETGWCAYLLPLLDRRIGRTGAVVVSGIIRGLWHLPLLVSPLIVSAKVGDQTTAWLVARCSIFTLQLAISNVFFGAVFGWLWYKTKSLPLAGWLHQWFDAARDLTGLFIVGFAGSLWARTIVPVVIAFTGCFFLMKVARGERVSGIFRYLV